MNEETWEGVCMWILGIIVLFLVLVCFGSWLHHKVRLKVEKRVLKAPGMLVQVNGHLMSVLVTGNQACELALVFMSGGGTCSPILDFKSLSTLFEEEYQVVVVEKAGYGFSEDSDGDRDIDTILEESRMALKEAGISKKLVLIPHSMSGIEAIHWANRYPDEVHAIIGLDPTVPNIYVDRKVNRLSLRMMRFIGDIGLLRCFPSIINHASAIRHGTLSEHEKHLYKMLFYRRFLTNSMIREAETIKDNSFKVARFDHTTVPLLFFISNRSGTGYTKEFWQGTLIAYLKGKGGRSVLLDCSHYVHDIEYLTIAEESVRFLRALS